MKFYDEKIFCNIFHGNFTKFTRFFVSSNGHLPATIVMRKQILDSEKIRRRVRLSNYHSISKTSTFMVTKPMCMDEGWNRVGLKLAEIISDSFKTTYVETVRVQVHANCRLRRIYFSNQEYKEDQLPNAYRMHRIAVMREKPKRILKKIAGSVDKKTTAVNKA